MVEARSMDAVSPDHRCTVQDSPCSAVVLLLFPVLLVPGEGSSVTSVVPYV
jgi:hypothetical protein